MWPAIVLAPDLGALAWPDTSHEPTGGLFGEPAEDDHSGTKEAVELDRVPYGTIVIFWFFGFILVNLIVNKWKAEELRLGCLPSTSRRSSGSLFTTSSSPFSGHLRFVLVAAFDFDELTLLLLVNCRWKHR